MNTQVRIVLTEKIENPLYYFQGLYKWNDYSYDITSVRARHKVIEMSIEESLERIYAKMCKENEKGGSFLFVPDNFLNKTILKILENNGYVYSRDLESNGFWMSTNPIQKINFEPIGNGRKYYWVRQTVFGIGTLITLLIGIR